jgi:multiple sugar transport system substrate-binding protein
LSRLLVIAFLLPLALAGCTTRDEDAGKVILSYTRWGDPAEMDSTRELIEQFMRENPDIVVRVDVVSWEQYWQKMATAVVTKTAQDVWLMSPAYVEQYAAAGHLLDLMPFISADPTFSIDDYFPHPFDDFCFTGDGMHLQHSTFGKGKLYAFTRDYNCRMLYYNRDHFDALKLPYPNEDWTWDDLVAAAKKLTIDFDGDGIIDQWGYAGLEYDAFARTNGAKMVDVVNKRSNYSSPEVVSAIQFCQDLVYKYKVSPPPAIQLEGDVFLTGKTSMTVEGTWEIRRFNRSKCQWDMTSIPVDRKGRRRITAGGGMGHCIYSGTRSPEAAWKLVKFLSGEVSQRELARSGTSVPVLNRIAFSDDFLAPFDRPPKATYPLIFKNLESEQHVPTYARGYLEYSEAIRNITQGVWLNTRDAAQACRLIDEKVNAVLAEQYGGTP